MYSMKENIYPIEQMLVQRSEREKQNKHMAKCFWFTGLSGSGKSTIARLAERQLFEKGFKVQVLDGDNIRNGMNEDLGFTLEDRAENIRRVAQISRLYIQSGFICICSFISPTMELRQLAKSILGENDYREVYISTSLDVCEKRDVKGLYKKARNGEIKYFTGIDSPFDVPLKADLEIDTDQLTIDESIDLFVEYVLKAVKLN